MQVRTFLLVAISVFIGNYLYSQLISETYTSSGSFIVPPGVTEISVECWGGGGAGGGATANNNGGGGGGGGAYARRNITVTPGQSFSFVVGQGGQGTTDYGAAGGTTHFNSFQVSAVGGNGGGDNDGGAGGTGANPNLCVGDVKFGGGNGAPGLAGEAGAGGGGAGSLQNGANASGMTSGIGGLEFGGDGGAGRNNYGHGNNGSSDGFGGGGGGGRKGGLISLSRNGGNGANGALRISYHVPQCNDISDGIVYAQDNLLCPSQSTEIVLTGDLLEYNGLVLQWQISTDEDNYNDIPNANEVVYITENLENISTEVIEFHYRCKIYCEHTDEFDYSQPTTVSVLPENSEIILYVKTDGNDNLSGLSWDNALQSVQKAIDIAAEYECITNKEVWVANGVYHPTKILSDFNGQQTATEFKSFIIYPGVKVYGGFQGSETSREIGIEGGRQISGEEMWDFIYPTIFDGSPENSYHVVWFASEEFSSLSYYDIEAVIIPETINSRSVLDGITIKGGFANSNIRIEDAANSRQNFIHLTGGGAVMTGNSEMRNCIVENNRAKYAGGGVAMYKNAVISNTLVRNNELIGANLYEFPGGTLGFGYSFWRSQGAGIAAYGSLDAFGLIENCLIENNTGQANDNYPETASDLNNKENFGGGLFLYMASTINTKVQNNSIAINPSEHEIGSGSSAGGGIFMYSRAVLDGCEVNNNGYVAGSQLGAGIYVDDKEFEAVNYSQLAIKNCFVHSNLAGGAIVNDANYLLIESSQISNNIGNGVQAYSNAKNSQTINSIITNNSGSAWHISSNSINQGNRLINSTVARNSSGVIVGNNNGHEIVNCIVWANNTNSSTISNALISYSAFSFVPPAGTGNIQISTNNELGPKFSNPTNWYGYNVSGWANADWSLLNQSPCVNSGNMSLLPDEIITDIFGNPRIMGCEIDMGAFESNEGAPEVIFTVNEDIIENNYLADFCFGQEINLVFYEALSGELPYTISWTVNDDLQHPLSGSEIIIEEEGQILFSAIPEPGNYEINIIELYDANNCYVDISEFYAEFTVILPEPVFSLNDYELSEFAEINLCEGENLTLIFDEPISGNYPFTISWVFDEDEEHELSGNNVEIYSAGQVLIDEILAVGEYSLEITEIYDDFGCAANLNEFSALINIKDLPAAQFELNGYSYEEGMTFNICSGNSIEFVFVDAETGEYPFLLSWIINDESEHEFSGQNLSITNPGQIIFDISPEPGNYSLRISDFRDSYSCEDISLEEFSVLFTVDDCTFAEAETISDISLYPNPANSVLFLGSSDFKNIRDISIINTEGKLVINKYPTSEITEISIEKLPPGLYLIIIQTQEKKITEKLIIE